MKADTEYEIEDEDDEENAENGDVAYIAIDKKKKMKKKKMLKHNPEYKTERSKLARYDEHSIDDRIDFIQSMLEDKEFEWSKDDGEMENVKPRTDGDYMSMVEKRAEEGRESSNTKKEAI